MTHFVHPLLAGILLGIATVPARLPAQEAKEEVFDGKTLGAWIKQLDSPDALRRLHAVEALAKMGPKAGKEATAALIAVMPPGDPLLRSKTAEALFHQGEKAIPQIAEAFRKTNNDEVRREFAGVLERFGTPAVPTFVEAIKDRNPDVRERSFHCLWRLGPKGKTRCRH